MNDDEHHKNLMLRLFDFNTCNDIHVTNSFAMLIVCKREEERLRFSDIILYRENSLMMLDES